MSTTITVKKASKKEVEIYVFIFVGNPVGA
jgi:hypothetical protein